MIEVISLLLGLVIAYSVYQNPYSDGAQMVYIGAAMNAVAFISNDFQMPVFDQSLTQERLNEVDFLHRHKLGNDKSNFKFLCDWLDFGFMDASPGDLTMFFGTFYSLTNFKLVSNGQNVVLKYEYRF